MENVKIRSWTVIEDGIPLEFFWLNCPTIYSLWIICSRTSSIQLKIDLPCYVFCASVCTCTNFFGTCTLVSTESSFSIHALMKNVACIGYIYICSRMQLNAQVVLLCALMKNVSRTEYICSRMKLTESSFSMCIDEQCCTYWIYKWT